MEQVKRLRYFVDGQWLESKTEKYMPVYNPSTGDVIAETPCCTAEEVEQDALNQVYQHMVVMAIVEKENLTMKKNFIKALVVVSMLALMCTACANTGKETEKTGNSTNATQATEVNKPTQATEATIQPPTEEVTEPTTEADESEEEKNIEKKHQLKFNIQKTK